WDFFIAHASADRDIADRIHALLSTVGKTFLDLHLKLGANWVELVPAAQDNARCTVVVITAATPAAWYTQSEIRRAIEMCRSARPTIIPVLYGEGAKLRYGLEQIRPVQLAGPADIDTLPDRIRDILDRAGDPPMAPAVPGRAVQPGVAAGHVATAGRRSGRSRRHRRAMIAMTATAVAAALLLAAPALEPR